MQPRPSGVYWTFAAVAPLGASGCNAFEWLLWSRLGSIDVNGSPKIVHREGVHVIEVKR